MALNQINLPDDIKVAPSKRSFWSLRPAHSEDLPWIVETLVQSRIEDQPLLKDAVTEERLNKEGQELLLSLLRIPSTKVLVAHKNDNTNKNIALIIYSTDPTTVIHHVFVRPSFRNNHIAKHLVRKALGYSDIKADIVPVTRLTQLLNPISKHGYKFKLVDQEFMRLIQLQQGEQ